MRPYKFLVPHLDTAAIAYSEETSIEQIVDAVCSDFRLPSSMAKEVLYSGIQEPLLLKAWSKSNAEQSVCVSFSTKPIAFPSCQNGFIISLASSLDPVQLKKMICLTFCSKGNL